MAATGFPTELIPVAVVKMFSSSAATGLLLDIYKHMVQIRCWDVRHRLCSAAQRPFLYHVGLFYVGKSKKTRYTLPGALLQPLPELWQVYFLCGKPKVVRIVLLFAWQPVCSSKIVKKYPDYDRNMLTLNIF